MHGQYKQRVIERSVSNIILSEPKTIMSWINGYYLHFVRRITKRKSAPCNNDVLQSTLQHIVKNTITISNTIN